MNHLPAHRQSVTFPELRPLSTQPITLVEGGVDAIPVPLGTTTAPAGSVEEFLLSRIDGFRSIAELAVLSGLTPREALHLVAGMVIEGAVAIASRSPLRDSETFRRVDPRVEPPSPDGEFFEFVDFADVFEELELETSSTPAPPSDASQTPSQPRVTIPVSHASQTADDD